MLDIRELIPSKDVVEYMNKQGRILTDSEKATLVYNHSGMGYDKKIKNLEIILEETKDEELKEQIVRRLAYDRCCLQKFYEREKDEIYILDVFIKDEQKWEECGYYASGKVAVACGKKFKESFSVYKTKLIMEEKEPDECCSKKTAALYFNAGGDMRDFYSTETEAYIEPEKVSFEYAYIDIPHPFKNGELVKIINNKLRENEIYIVECNKDEVADENIRKQKLTFYDYSDASLRLAAMNSEAEFWHEHAKIADIEFATLEEDNLKKQVLECAADLVRGCGGLSDFQFACEEYCRKNAMKIF